MTTPGDATVYRYVSDGQMAAAAARDAMARTKRPPLWFAIGVIGFAVGFVASYRGNRASLPYYRAEVIRIAIGWGLVFVILAVGAALLGIVLGRTAIRRHMRRLYPVGSETEVELADETLVLRRPSGARTIPYGDIRIVRSREHALWIFVRGRPMAEALPASLLPPDAVDGIRARSVGAVPVSTSTPEIASGRQAVVPARWASHVAAMTLRRNVVRPKFWARVGLGILVSIPMAMVGGRGWLALTPTLALLSLGLSYLQTRRSVAWALPVGSVQSVEVQDDRLVSRSPRWSRVIPLADIRRVDLRDDVVFLEMTTRPPLLVLPRNLVPDSLIDQHRGARV
jgi:hypothetical protein